MITSFFCLIRRCYEFNKIFKYNQFMKTKNEKVKSFTKEMKKLKKEDLLKEEHKLFIKVLKKAIKPQSSSR